MQRKLLGNISVDFNATGQIRQILEKKWQYNEVVHQLCVDLRKLMIQLGGRSYIIFLLSLVSP